MAAITKEQADNRINWLLALRSGEWKQGVGELRNHDRYCCIGVACDVLGKKLATVSDAHSGYKLFMEQLNIYNDFKEKLIDLNDKEGYSFKKIARYCERAWKDDEVIG